jgi:hypothetical protein
LKEENIRILAGKIVPAIITTTAFISGATF